MADESAGESAPLPDNGATTKMTRPTADDFEPDVPVDGPGGESETHAIDARQVSTVTPPTSGRPPADYGGDPTREGLPFHPFEAWSDVARVLLRREGAP